MSHVLYDRLEEQAARDALAGAAARCAAAHVRVAQLEDARALVKADAIARLMASGVATSATAAEKVVERDEEYAAHRATQRAAEIERWTALGEWEAAKLRARITGGRFND